MTTYTEIMASSEARARPILGEVCAQIADVQVRNRGTIGGNICTSDPTNHLPPLLAALGAEMVIHGAAGERTVAAHEFFLGVYMTAVGTGELLTKIRVPAGRSDGFAAVTLGIEGTCIASAAASINGGVKVALGCVDAVPVMLGPASADAGRRARRRPGGRFRPALRRTRLERVPHAPRRGARRSRRRSGIREDERLTPVEASAPAVSTSRSITVTINGTTYEREVEARKLLIHFIRDDLDLTGSHIGCDTGNCGACSVIVDGKLVKSCMMLAVQADGSSIETVEGLADGEELNRLQTAFSANHALQCGYCTPGMLMSATALLRSNPQPSEDEIKKAIQGNICRCTGYWNIFKAVQGGVRTVTSTTIAPERVETEAPRGDSKGQNVPRKEDRRLVQGEGVFVDDVKRHGMGYIHFVRSPYAHAHIISIDVSKAEALPGVYGTLTGEEVASLTDPFFQLAKAPASNMQDYALAVGKVRFVGESVVAVVAETRELARDASELVEIEYEPIAPIVDARDGRGRRAGAARGGRRRT